MLFRSGLACYCEHRNTALNKNIPALQVAKFHLLVVYVIQGGIHGSMSIQVML
jgi:hypothetical protein